MPSLQVTLFAALLVAILYAMVPEGRWRNTGKWVAAGLVALTALGRIALGADAPTDVLVAAAIGVTLPLVAFRLFAPNEVFPVAYRRGRAAHLDVSGPRGVAIRRGLEDQLGLVVEELKPFGLAGSAGSTPLRITVKGDPPTYLFGKLYAHSHLRADRWYKLGRELLYGRLEDEKPFNTVRRLVQQEDYALRVCRDAGLPSPAPFGFVELTPEREYLLVTEFFDGAVELGEAEVDEQIIDDGLGIVRRLWDAGLAHRDVKPANLLVRDGRMLLIDVAFIEARPTPWRQAVDLANMMLCLALRSNPEQVYRRAQLQFNNEEITEGFAAARGLALPSQLRRMLRERAATCTPSSSACCQTHRTQSESSAGACAGSVCWRWWRCWRHWSGRTLSRTSPTTRPARRRCTSAASPAPTWSLSGLRPSRCRRRRWCHACGPCQPAGR
jgi:tRNA A-37 threonylcarbamoyl transferase component Bud32